MANLQEIVEYRGVEGLVAAEVLTDDADSYTTGEVFAIAGVAEISKSTESSSEAHYYDNIPAVVINSTGADTITVSTSAIPLDVVAKLTGQRYNEETASLVEGVRESKYFAIGYQTKKTNGDVMYVWRLKTSCAVPEETSATENDGTDANGQSLEFTGIATTHKFENNADSKGNPRGAKALVVDTAKGVADVSTFFDTVTTPDTLVPISIATPANVTAQATADKTITVAWDAVEGATHYRVYRYSVADQGYVFYNEVEAPALHFDNVGLVANTKYYYKVTAAIEAGGEIVVESAQSPVAYAMAITAPAAPANVAAEATGNLEITITYDTVSGATFYSTYRAASATGSFDYIGSSTTGSYVDTDNLTAGRTYYYKVRSVINDSNGKVPGPLSTAVSATAAAG